MPNYGISNIIIGKTSNRATASPRGGWMGQGEVIASYEGAIPRQAVQDLIAWEPIKVPSANLIPVDDVALADTVLPDGTPAMTRIVDGVKSIVRSDTFANLGRFNDDFNGASYASLEERTYEATGGAPALAVGELNGGRQFFIQYGMDENLHDGTTGLDFMPYLLFQSSLDGSLANTWSRGSIIAKCDNMFPQIRREARSNSQVKFKRSRFSAERMDNLPALLGVQAQNTQDFARHMVRIPVSRQQFVDTMNLLVALPDPEKVSKAAVTRVQNKRDTIDALYQNSPMVADWNGTAFGAFQAFNTYHNREVQVRGANRIDRQFDRVLRGVTADEDAATLDALERVLGRELVAV